MATYYEEEKKGGGFAGKLLAVFLGFLFGIIVTIGSIAGSGTTSTQKCASAKESTW